MLKNSCNVGDRIRIKPLADVGVEGEDAKGVITEICGYGLVIIVLNDNSKLPIPTNYLELITILNL